MCPNEESFYTSIYAHIDFEYSQYVLSMNLYEQDQSMNIFRLNLTNNPNNAIHNHSM